MVAPVQQYNISQGERPTTQNWRGPFQPRWGQNLWLSSIYIYIHLSIWWYSVSFFTCMRTLPWKQTRRTLALRWRWWWQQSPLSLPSISYAWRYKNPFFTWISTEIAVAEIACRSRVVTAGCCVSRCKSVASRWKHCKELAKTWISLRLGID